MPAKRPKRTEAAAAPTSVMLLRGINVGGNKTVPMAKLKALLVELGFTDVVTLLNSGNAVFRSTLSPSVVERTVQEALARAFGFEVDVIVRSAADFAALGRSTVFADAVKTRPHLVMLGLSQQPLAADLVQRAQPFCVAHERIVVDGEALWIDYADGSGRSKLTPVVLNRLAGSPLTTRNWNTVMKLVELLRAGGGSASR